MLLTSLDFRRSDDDHLVIRHSARLKLFNCIQSHQDSQREVDRLPDPNIPGQPVTPDVA